MFRKILFVAAAVAASALICPGVEAGDKKVEEKLTAVSVGVGAAASAGYFALGNWRWKWDNVNGITSAGAWALTTVGCAAVSPMVATVVLDRPLTQREAGVLFGDCLLPIVGGWLVNQAYDAHPDWDPAYEPPHGKKKKHAKM